MGIERVGFRRLYDAIGCGIEKSTDASFSFKILNDYSGTVYLGPNPHFGVMQLNSDAYIIPGQKTKSQLNSDYKSDLFLEISFTFDVSVDDSISDGLSRKEETARDKLLTEVNPKVKLLSEVLDTISGIVGLKFHRQLIIKPIIENSFILSGPELVSRISGEVIETLLPIKITKSGLNVLDSYLNSLGELKEKDYKDSSRAFHWLLRAWRERDHAAKFLYLFIPLECILESPKKSNAEITENIEILKHLVSESNNENKESLLGFLNRLEYKFSPTLRSRFESLAESKKIEGWEADIEAFKKFNRTRNLLLHSGKKEILSHLNIDEETRTLEDLVERYVSLAVFGDANVYVSRWRPNRKIDS